MSFDLHGGAEAAAAPPLAIAEAGPRLRGGLAALRRRPELPLLLALAAILYFWALSRNGWANTYYSAAVRSMSHSWHAFLFASLDQSGVMTVDKPPLALWVEALSVRAFGFSSLSMLVPQAVMGIVSVGLLYDLVRRRFGRVGGFAAGLALALTPITVAISRYNQPDALLALCTIAALWFAVRGLESGRTRDLVLAGLCVGLGFETKMLVALVVVPAIAAAWTWVAPAARGRLHALRQLLAGGAAMTVAGAAWPLLVELTPAASRPWISGTSDNRVLSLIFEYNGVGRVDGQAGGPAGFGGSQFGGQTGPLRLLNSALGGQGGWLLGFAGVSAIGLLAATRLRRSDARSGWLLAVGGSFLTTAVLFSFASGIFHPYYVSLLAPFTEALVGAGVAYGCSAGRGGRFTAALAVLAGVVTELVVLGDYSGQLRWLVPVLIAAGVTTAAVLVLARRRSARLTALAIATALLLVAPGAWAFDTLGRSLTGTFPEGGPANVQAASGFGGPGGRFGRPGGSGGFPGAPGGGFAPPGTGAAGAAPGSGSPGPTGEGVPSLLGPSGSGAGSSTGSLGGNSAGPPAFSGGAPRGFGRGGLGAGGPGGFGGAVGKQVVAYVKAHGGGTIALGSQSSAAESILAEGADVAGIGGFSGRESDVSIGWLAEEVREGHIRWVLGESTSASAGGGFGGRGLPGDGRQGSRKAIAAAEKACTRVTIGSGSASEGAASPGARSSSTTVLYDCGGRAAALARLAG